MKNRTGFNLIELMITLAIIGILLTITVPSYSHYLMRVHRIAAVTALQQLALKLESYHFENNSYANADFAKLSVNPDVANHAYQLSIREATDSSYLIVATPNSSALSNHDECGSLFLFATGEKQISGTSNIQDCWY